MSSHSYENQTIMDGVQIEDTSNAEKDPLAIWTGFYKKTLAERQDQLKLLYPHIEEKQNLPLSVILKLYYVFHICGLL